MHFVDAIFCRIFRIAESQPWVHMKNVLAIETSSQTLSIALKTGSRQINETRMVGFLKHAENLLPMISRLLKKNGVKIQDVSTFLINRGPGSFTGLRIGFATIKGFLCSQKRQVFGGLSHDLIAHPIELPVKSRLAVCLDAHRQRIYTRFYERGREKWKACGKTAILTLPELSEQLADFSSDTTVHIAGDALRRYGDVIDPEAVKTSKICFLSDRFWYPRAASLIEIFQKNASLLQELKRPADMIPLYFRLSEAEERKQEHAIPS